MLIQYLNGAIKDLKSLISLTELDIEDIKCANHEQIFDRNNQRDILIKEFKTKKSLITQEVEALHSQSPDSKLEDLFSQEIVDLFSDMRTALNDLKKINSDYARMVFAVSEFFTSLMNKIIPQEDIVYDAHKKSTLQPQASFLQIEV